jgi:hypothetical protein
MVGSALLRRIALVVVVALVWLVVVRLFVRRRCFAGFLRGRIGCFEIDHLRLLTAKTPPTGGSAGFVAKPDMGCVSRFEAQLSN